MYYPDLMNVTGITPFMVLPLRTIGWLDSAHAVPHGDVSAMLLNRVYTFCCHPNFVTMGRHACTLCDPINSITDAVSRCRFGSGDIVIPSVDRQAAYLCPDLLWHYMIVHGYEPPSEFQHALRHTPERHSADYHGWIDAIMLNPDQILRENSARFNTTSTIPLPSIDSPYRLGVWMPDPIVQSHVFPLLWQDFMLVPLHEFSDSATLNTCVGFVYYDHPRRVENLYPFIATGKPVIAIRHHADTTTDSAALTALLTRTALRVPYPIGLLLDPHDFPYVVRNLMNVPHPNS